MKKRSTQLGIREMIEAREQSVVKDGGRSTFVKLPIECKINGCAVETDGGTLMLPEKGK